MIGPIGCHTAFGVSYTVRQGQKGVSGLKRGLCHPTLAQETGDNWKSLLLSRYKVTTSQVAASEGEVWSSFP